VIKDVIEIVIVALNERNERRTKILSYLMTKLSGAGFSIFIFL
jgi:mannitol/fructose-specific phosphotransferase system IIA component (Ntr-type)